MRNRMYDTCNVKFKYSRFKYGACRKSCKAYHICIINVAAALRVFELIKSVHRHSKTQKMLYTALGVKFDAAMEYNHQIVNVRYSFFQTINDNLEVFRSQFIHAGVVDWALEASAAMLVHKIVVSCV